MDFYLNKENNTQRLLDEYQLHKNLIIAFDFDDTVYDFHKKGRKYDDVITLLRKLKAIGCYLICWTGQEDVEFVKNYLNEHSVPFDNINEQAEFYSKNSRKIYANAYLDDRAGLAQVYQELNELIIKIEKL